jgi:crossover junction endodeoxyribonuclease RusA
MLRCPHEPQNSYIAKETKAALGLCLFGLWPDSFPERRLTARPLCESGILRQNLPAYTRKHTGGEIVSALTFTVHGQPQPQGSMQAFIPRGWNRAILTNDNKRTKPWKQEIADTALCAMEEAGFECAGKNVAFKLAITFRFLKPKSAKRTVIEKTTRPDLDKCVRSCLDALKGIIWFDDSCVVEIHARKEFGAQAGAKITFCEIEHEVGVLVRHLRILDQDTPF